MLIKNKPFIALQSQDTIHTYFVKQIWILNVNSVYRCHKSTQIYRWIHKALKNNETENMKQKSKQKTNWQNSYLSNTSSTLKTIRVYQNYKHS